MTYDFRLIQPASLRNSILVPLTKGYVKVKTRLQQKSIGYGSVFDAERFSFVTTMILLSTSLTIVAILLLTNDSLRFKNSLLFVFV